MSLVSCVSWVPKGFAQSKPFKIKLDEEELGTLFNEEIENDDLITCKADGETIDETYNLDGYDDEKEDFDDITNFANIATYKSNAKDQYLNYESDSDDSSGIEIQAEDNLLACGIIHDDGKATIDVYVYNEFDGSFFIHHDFMLPYLPLSCEWLSYNFVDSDANSEESNHSINTKGNYLAIGSMKSFIDIWDLDIDGATEPFLTLRHPSGLKKSKLKGVLSLAWNRLSNNIFASGTAGGIVCLWDIETCIKLQEYPLHNDKVVCMRWHRFESNLLLSGGTDGIVNLIDCRVPSSLSLSGEATAPNYKNWDLGYPVDDIQWHDSDPFYFLAAANNGTVTCYDCRQNVKNTSVYQIDLLSSGDISSVGKTSEKKILPSKKAKSRPDNSENDQNEQSISMAIKYPRLYTCHSNENVVKIWNIFKKASPTISSSIKPKFIGQKSIWSRGETSKCANRRIHALALLDDYDISPINTRSSTTADFKQKKFDCLASGSQRHQPRDVVAFATIGTSKPFVKQFKTALDLPDDAEQKFPIPPEKTLMLSAKNHKYSKNKDLKKQILFENTRKLMGVDKLITKKNGKGSRKQKNALKIE